MNFRNGCMRGKGVASTKFGNEKSMLAEPETRGSLSSSACSSSIWAMEDCWVEVQILIALAGPFDQRTNLQLVVCRPCIHLHTSYWLAQSSTQSSGEPDWLCRAVLGSTPDS
jgi:hypothetical protein